MRAPAPYFLDGHRLSSLYRANIIPLTSNGGLAMSEMRRKPGAAATNERSSAVDMQAIADLFVAAPNMSARQMTDHLHREGYPSVKQKTCANMITFGTYVLEAVKRRRPG